LFEVADPRVRAVTVLGVDATGDLRNATVHVTVMGTESEQALAMKGLHSAAGFLQSRVAARLQTRFTPVLSFRRDDSVKKSIAISRLIDQTLAADRENPDEPVEEDET
jgi:ribosome-binding factor A